MTRTHDLLITNQLLYRLSYTSKLMNYTIRPRGCQHKNPIFHKRLNTIPCVVLTSTPRLVAQRYKPVAQR